jgi:hypothetical protein
MTPAQAGIWIRRELIMELSGDERRSVSLAADERCARDVHK